MLTKVEVEVGPGTLHSLREIASSEGVEPADVMRQAVAVWSQLRGAEERQRVGLVAMGVVVDRLRSAAGGHPR